MKLEVDLGQKFDIMGLKVSLFTIIVLTILTLLVFKMCFKTYPTQEKFTSHEGKINAYNFNTSWCGYSTQFQEPWDDFTQQAQEIDVVAHDIKCDKSENDEICKKYGDMTVNGEPILTGYPTVLFEVPGNENPIVYNNDRTAEALMKFTSSLM
jgi:hypothetical protein